MYSMLMCTLRGTDLMNCMGIVCKNVCKFTFVYDIHMYRAHIHVPTFFS